MISFLLMIICPLCVVTSVMFFVAMRCRSRSKVAADLPVAAVATIATPAAAYAQVCTADTVDADGVEMVSAHPVASPALPPMSAVVATRLV